MTVDMENSGDNDILNFIVRRLDTQILGVVVNDRDQDSNTVDAGEGLANVTIQLYRDGVGAVTLDTLVATTTTSATGSYSFTGLPEARYIVKAVQPSGATVLRGYDGAAGARTIRDTTVVTTGATTTGSGANNTRVVGTNTPVPLPRWDYATSSVFFDGRTSFTFLVNGNVATGQITNAGAPVANAQVRMRRCMTSAGAVSPPAAGACTTYFDAPTTFVTATTDPTGFFTYPNLLEGVYEIAPVVASTPTSRLFLLMRNGESPDNERGDFTQP